MIEAVLAAVIFTVIGAFALPVAEHTVGTWVWFYSLVVPAPQRTRRRAEMRSHVADEVATKRSENYDNAHIAVFLFAHAVLGAPADVSWTLGLIRRTLFGKIAAIRTGIGTVILAVGAVLLLRKAKSGDFGPAVGVALILVLLALVARSAPANQPRTLAGSAA